MEQRFSTILVGGLPTFYGYVGDFPCHFSVISLFGLFTHLGIYGLYDLQYKQIFVAMLSLKRYRCQWNMFHVIPRRFVYFFCSISTVELIIMLILLILDECSEIFAAGAVIPFKLLLDSVLREVVCPNANSWLVI